jgi:GTP cyclohydrolase I
MNSRDPNIMAIADVQGSADSRAIPINKVGIKSIRHPVKVLDKNGGVQHTIAEFNMYVGLPHNFKGTHMSRFVELLNTNEREFSVENFESMLRNMVERPWKPRPAMSKCTSPTSSTRKRQSPRCAV